MTAYSFPEETGGIGINLTPLIDVVFVVLIMFIIIAPMHVGEEVDLPAGHALLETAPARGDIRIYVKGDNTLWFQKKCVTQKELTEALTAAKRESPEAVPRIYQDKKAFFGTYQEVKNITEQAGFTRMEVILNPA